MCGTEPLHAGCTEQVDAIVGNEAQLLDSRAHMKAQLLKFNEAPPLVWAELEILPLLIHLLLFAIDHLLYFLGLLVNVYRLAGADSLRVAELGRCIAQHIVKGVDVAVRRQAQRVCRLRVPSRYRLAVDLLDAGHFNRDGVANLRPRLGHELLEIARHGGGDVWEGGGGEVNRDRNGREHDKE